MNRSHVKLGNSYDALRQEALRLQEQVQDLKGQLEFWSKAQVVLVKFPEDAVLGTGANVPSNLLKGSQDTQVVDPVLGSDFVYPAL